MTKRYKSEKRKGPIQEWGREIDWKRRVKAVCKPCWEIKYCPYGILVEDFDLRDEQDHKGCRIYGHDCPVFYVSEPFSETKELRNISRSIPRATQFRVLKRENQICSVCSNSIKDEDIEFDHIIPWSKGGSSDESNIRLLCRACNRKKGKKFEDEYLIKDLKDRVKKPISSIAIKEFMYAVIELLKFSQTMYLEEKRYPEPHEVCRFFGRRKVRPDDELWVDVMTDIDNFFTAKKPQEMKQTTFKALKYRWGFVDRKIYSIKQASLMFRVDTHELLDAEISLFDRLGWPIKVTDVTKKQWLKL
jgi:hypothetical protein